MNGDENFIEIKEKFGREKFRVKKVLKEIYQSGKNEDLKKIEFLKSIILSFFFNCFFKFGYNFKYVFRKHNSLSSNTDFSK